jgi:septin 7
MLTFVLFSPFMSLDNERKAHETKMSKMEAEMKAVFAQKVAEKENKLRQSEEEVSGKQGELTLRPTQRNTIY